LEINKPEHVIRIMYSPEKVDELVNKLQALVKVHDFKMLDVQRHCSFVLGDQEPKVHPILKHFFVKVHRLPQKNFWLTEQREHFNELFIKYL
jgi:hypothetical protein